MFQSLTGPSFLHSFSKQTRVGQTGQGLNTPQITHENILSTLQKCRNEEKAGKRDISIPRHRLVMLHSIMRQALGQH